VNVTSNLDKVGSKTIVPLALLVAELVSNSIKHAFDDQGIIHIIFTSDNDGQLLLTYEDNGSGKEQENQSSFGLQLIETLTEQLDGEYTRSSTETGTRYSFKLSNLDD
jgi:two-component sensor histidine kinase